MIRGVLFDLGDTLINFGRVDLPATFRRSAQETYDLLAERFGLVLPSFERYHRSQLRSLRWAYFVSRITGREFDATNVLRQTSRRLKIDVPPDFFEELAWRWYRPLAEDSHVDPDAVPMLDELRNRGLRLGIVSNTFVPASSLDRHLKAAGLFDYFPVRVYSCDLGLRKPHPEIFRHALRRIALASNATLFVGDNPRFDLAGARGVGMFAALKASRPPRRRLDGRSFMIARLAELPGIIDRIDREFPDPVPAGVA